MFFPISGGKQRQAQERTRTGRRRSAHAQAALGAGVHTGRSDGVQRACWSKVLTMFVCVFSSVLLARVQAGLVYSEKGNLGEILCKPKLIPIKSRSLMELEQKEKELLGAGAT